jgi:PTH1 family peptidyl-tRNA hydrolase
MHLIVGLGNPGKKYTATRHNIGFRVVDALSQKKKLAFTASSFQGDVAHDGTTLAERLYLLKPSTFMNLSGESVAAITQFYKIPLSEILVIHDDLDLPLGRLRFVRTGSAGGHNGIKSLIDHLGTPDFPHLKIGIGRPKTVQQDVVDYVLQKFTPEEEMSLSQIIDKSVEAIEAYLAHGLQSAMNAYNQK